MFLDSIMRRNKKLVDEFSKESFDKGLILPNSYVLDWIPLKKMLN